MNSWAQFFFVGDPPEFLEQNFSAIERWIDLVLNQQYRKSAIDSYNHTTLGFVECPSSFDFVHASRTRRIAIYLLLEDIPDDENDFDGKEGDILLGGGSGEAPAMRISIPKALYFFFKESWDNYESLDELFKTFWTPTEAYFVCDGFAKLGWSVHPPVEIWLAEQMCLLLIENFEEYRKLVSGNNQSKSKLTFTQV
jgi:hypothetical protein